ncbi:MAG: 5-formyltetrahydrofolate cyclo-ligase [Neomegalonema sp.]|nr:5-formyltetrahydrofolate cyclo-ligase [Neomegalonema sp.]
MIEEKAALRKEIAARRKAAHMAGATSAAAAASALFLHAIKFAAGEEIAGYRPIRSEIDPTPLMRALHEAGARISVPIIVGDAPLRFRRWTPEAVMVEGPFGAEVPAGGEWAAPSLFITPLLGFDRTGARLGYGKGHYDRTFAAARAQREIRSVGLAFAAQEIASAPQEPTDQRLDAIVTEQEAIICSASGIASDGQLR